MGFLLNFITLPKCHSTNTEALKGVSEARYAHGTIIYTPEQTHGRGRGGNKWVSEPHKNATFSMVVNLPGSDTVFINKLSMLTCIWLVDFLREELKPHLSTLDEILIKWPNDVLVNEKKIAGILIETKIHANRSITAVVGVGLNVNQTDFGYLNATSMALISKKTADVAPLVRGLSNSFYRILFMNIGKNFNEIKTEYLNRAHGVKDLIVLKADTLEDSIYGYLADIHENGEIYIQQSGNQEGILLTPNQVRITDIFKYRFRQ